MERRRVATSRYRRMRARQGGSRNEGSKMIRRSSSGRAAPRRPVFRVLALILAMAFFASACGGADAEPSLTSERPEPPPTSATAPVVEPVAEPSTTTAVPLSRTTEPTILVTTPPGVDELGVEVPPPLLPDVPLPDEMTNPALTELPADQLLPPPPPLEPPPAAPAWEPVAILVSNDDFNGIIPVTTRRTARDWRSPTVTSGATRSGATGWSPAFCRVRRAMSGSRSSCPCGPTEHAAGCGPRTSPGPQ